MRPELGELLARRPELAACASEITAGHALLRRAFARGRKLLICGNGGSSADAEHWAAELLKSFVRPRPLPVRSRARLPSALARRLQDGLPALPLTGFTALRSAVGNDVTAELEYAQLVWALGRPGDVLAGLTTSGDAANVCAAFEAGRARGLATLALTGRTGGRIKNLATVCIRAPERECWRVQELHLAVYHALSLMLEEDFFGARRGEAIPRPRFRR